MDEERSSRDNLTAVMGPYGPESEFVHPIDQCQAKVLSEDGSSLPCSLPWSFQVVLSQAQYDTRDLAEHLHPSMRGLVGRRVCWFHARLTKLNAERWELPVRVVKVR